MLRLGSAPKRVACRRLCLMYFWYKFVTAAILLTTIASVVICTMKAVNAQGNATNAGGSNMTKSNMTNATSGAAVRLPGMTEAAKASAARREGSPQQ
jgi:hypothetical protein